MATPKPSQPPPADMTALVQRVDELSLAVLQKNFLAGVGLDKWKRWVGGEKPDYDGTATGSLRDVLNAYGMNLDQIKTAVDALTQTTIELRADVQALQEAPASHPFP